MEVYLKWVMAAVKTEPVVYAPAPNPKSSEHSFEGAMQEKLLEEPLSKIIWVYTLDDSCWYPSSRQHCLFWVAFLFTSNITKQKRPYAFRSGAKVGGGWTLGFRESREVIWSFKRNSRNIRFWRVETRDSLFFLAQLIWPMNSNLELTLSTFCNYSLLHSRPFIRRSWKHTLMITLTTSWLCRGVWARDPFQHFPPFGQLLRDQFWFETPKSRNSGTCRMIQALCKSPYKLCPCRMQRELREKKSIRAHLKHARGHIVITEHVGWLNGDHRFGFDEGSTASKKALSINQSFMLRTKICAMTK